MSINFIKHTDFKIKEISIYDVTGKKIQNWFINNSSGGHIAIFHGMVKMGVDLRLGQVYILFVLRAKKNQLQKKVTYLK